MSDPVMLAVATALAAKAAEGLADGGRAAFAALARLVRRKLAPDPAARAALESARARPSDEARVRSLAEVLELAASEDPEFAEEVNALWRGVRSQWAAASDGGVVNQASGKISGVLVQAHDVHGGISFGSPGPAGPDRDR